MKVWKKVVTGSVALTMAGALAACGNDGNNEENAPANDPADNNANENDANDNDNANSNEAAEDQEEVTITYARGYDATGATDVLIDAFMEEHPHITVEFREMPADTGQSHDQYVTEFSAGDDTIDVFDADVIWPAEFAQAQYVLELDRFIERDGIDMDEFFPGTVEAGQYEGRQWAMPKFTDAGVLYYRSDIVDTPPETWDELIEMAGEYMGQEGTEYGYLMQANQYEGLVVNAVEFIGAYGGAVLDENENVVVNSPETVAAIEKMVEIVNSDITPSNINNFMETETHNAFLNGDAVFARNWPYMQAMTENEEESNIVGNSAFSLLPAGDAGSASGLGGWMTMINRNSNHPEEAWELMKFMSSYEGQKISAIEGGNAPTMRSLYDDEEVRDSAPLFADEGFVETLENAVPRPVSPIYPQISDLMQIEISRALAEDITPQEAVENMEQAITDALAE
ncbi:ABC transporter substrate-binding protein [Salisediminibacterium selenitireducens]|uniref:Extracellular solute-binding protein family 1 n=1 Tax=Bacillus selenitireducens (strain ATCC 700615 / DSM 15326 / MLS10) TaxID=439292 RepID=D6XT33_BACIE|nr:ABC transporter substrate-binding protein [Salisediminibacterium selenitireducens]ADH98969.1 extracellular solute-binding protein family 1 [[Bacillus] selenitireducens MLS10]